MDPCGLETQSRSLLTPDTVSDLAIAISDGVSIDGGVPKWIVFFHRKSQHKMDEAWGYHPIN